MLEIERIELFTEIERDDSHNVKEGRLAKI